MNGILQRSVLTNDDLLLGVYSTVASYVLDSHVDGSIFIYRAVVFGDFLSTFTLVVKVKLRAVVVIRVRASVSDFYRGRTESRL